jgi:Zn finger protein HypA/HybF involved in hydrogenase expression
MHEYGLANDIARSVRAEAERAGGHQIAKLEVEVGGMARLSTELLSGWLQEALADLAGAEFIQVSRAPVIAVCPQCKSRRRIRVNEDDLPALDPGYQRCPKCGAENVQLSGGTDCRIRALTFRA